MVAAKKIDQPGSSRQAVVKSFGVYPVVPDD
jgi:hypothetical protein